MQRIRVVCLFLFALALAGSRLWTAPKVASVPPAAAVPADPPPDPAGVPAEYRAFVANELVVDQVKIKYGHAHTFEEYGPRLVTVLGLTARPTPGGPPFILRGLDKSQTVIDARTGERFTKADLGPKLYRLHDAAFTTDTGETLTPIRRDVREAGPGPQSEDRYHDVAVSEDSPSHVNYYFSPPGDGAKWVLVSLPAGEFATRGRVTFRIPAEKITRPTHVTRPVIQTNHGGK